jgi:dihydroneopterin aldolase
MTPSARIELRGLHLACTLGEYPAGVAVPDVHLLDLTLTLPAALVLVGTDDMGQVFDYDPLLARIDQIARAQPYATQEYLLWRIVTACAAHPQIAGLEAALHKGPVLGGSVGLRVTLGADALAALRASASAG